MRSQAGSECEVRVGSECEVRPGSECEVRRGQNVMSSGVRM